MKKSELKKLLKPMIKECIKEVIFEEGVLSNIVSEVAQGIGRPALVEAKQHVAERDTARDERLAQQETTLKRRRSELLEAINKDAYGGVDLFEGTDPLSAGGSVKEGPQAQGPLSDISPNDPGVDISNIMDLAGNRWAAHLK